jgi:hypothetical protein
VAVAGDEVRVAEGLYELTSQVVVDKGITVLGVDGAEATTIDCGGLCRGFYLDHADAVLDGLTVSNGYATLATPSSLRVFGGGIACLGGTVRHCTVSKCRLELDEDASSIQYADGAGIYCSDGGVVADCLVRLNQINGGMGRGVGIFCEEGAQAERCHVEFNYGVSGKVLSHGVDACGGGVFCSVGSALRNCRVQNNVVRALAGGRGLGGGVYATEASIDDCIIHTNQALGSYSNNEILPGADAYGGGLYTYQSDIQQCDVRGNTAKAWAYIGPDRTGESCGGGIYAVCNDRMRNCLVVENVVGETRYWDSVAQAGGIYCYSGRVQNCTVSGNKAISARTPEILSRGGGVVAQSSHFQNTIIIDNQADDCENLAFDGTPGWRNFNRFEHCLFVNLVGENPTQDIDEASQSLNATYKWYVEDDMPIHLFVNPAGGDYHLYLGGTPTVIDRGMDLSGEGVLTDLDGVLRPQDGGYPTGAVYDLGAYEFTPIDSRVRYVSPSGQHIYPYTNWTMAAHDIQTALNSCPEDHTVLVDDGVYAIRKEIAINRPVTLRSMNGPEATMIDAQHYTRGMRVNVKGWPTVVDGFTITRGFVKGENPVTYPYSGADAKGAGVLLESGLLTNCIISNCRLESDDAGYLLGAGVFCDYGGQVIDCRIVGNEIDGAGVPVGGGLYVMAYSLVKDCLIASNVIYSGLNHPYSSSTARGGGILLADGAVLTNSVIQANSAIGRGYGASAHGGGMYCQGSVRNCVIEGNLAIGGTCTHTARGGDAAGGGIYNDTSREIKDCSITGNTAMGGMSGVFETGGSAQGGGLYYEWGGQAMRCVLADNWCIGGNGLMGDAGPAQGAGVYMSYYSRMQNFLVVSNVAVGGSAISSGCGGNAEGAGIYCWANSNVVSTYEGPAVVHCTVIANETRPGPAASGYRMGSGLGAGLFARQGSIYNSIVYSNIGSVEEWDGMESNLVFQACCTQPLPEGIGNIQDAPLFVNAAGSDYHLAGGSPCIDAGVVMTGIVCDLDRVARPLDGNNDGHAAYDMGAYEYVHASADSDGDGLLDTDELAAAGLSPINPDCDGDGMNDGDETFAGTDPVNAASVFEIVTSPANRGSSRAIYWSSVAGKHYSVESSTNLLTGFDRIVASGITATPPLNSHTVSNALDSTRVYYRVLVEDEAQ